MYSGQKVDNPIAERTRKVQEWGVLTSWQQKFTRPITFADLAAKWAPGSGAYGKMLEAVAEKFDEDFCSKPDPRPQLVAEARGQQPKAIAAPDAKPADVKPIERPSGAELARRAIDDGKKEQDQTRSALGVQDAAKPGVPFKVLNAPAIPEPDKQLTEAPAIETPDQAQGGRGESQGRRRQPPPARLPPSLRYRPTRRRCASPPRPEPPSRWCEPPAAGQKCRVWTASYGGQKAMIIRSIVDKVVNYTVLDVNEGAETARPKRSSPPTPRTARSPANSPASRRPSTRPSSFAPKADPTLADDTSEPLRRGSSAACHLSAERTGPLRVMRLPNHAGAKLIATFLSPRFASARTARRPSPRAAPSCRRSASPRPAPCRSA